MGGDDLSRRGAITSNISTKGGDYLRKGCYSRKYSTAARLVQVKDKGKRYM